MKGTTTMETEEDDDIDEIREAIFAADNILHFAILQFYTTVVQYGSEHNATLRLLGLEMSLLRHAARLSLIQKSCAGAVSSKASFGKLARDMYADMQRYQAKTYSKKFGPALDVVVPLKPTTGKDEEDE
jgi:hypothetical protein